MAKLASTGSRRPGRGLHVRFLWRFLCPVLASLSAIFAAVPAGASPVQLPVREVSASPSPSVATETSAIPVWAYYYIWFDPSSWDRAKADLPAIGTYTSDERAVMRDHIELARSAGIDAFLVSWKNTRKLSERLARLVDVAKESDFHLGIVYQGLDFTRRPIEVRQVCADLLTFADLYAANPVFRTWGTRPVVIWTGTDQFSSADQERCVAPVRDRLLVLASSRNTAEWARASTVFAGNAYYWSSVNPEKSWYLSRLAEMGDAVHASGGLWVAPAAPGFDTRLTGGQSLVARDDGKTLSRELTGAVESHADAIGLISWNEFTENTHVEPSRSYGTTALQTLATFTGSTARLPEIDSNAPRSRSTASGVNGVAALIIFTGLLGAVLVRSQWKKGKPPTAAGDRAEGPQ